jgi:inhibitor of cysteine peptidase
LLLQIRAIYMNLLGIFILLQVGMICACGCTGSTGSQSNNQPLADITPQPEMTEEPVPDMPLSFEEEIAELQNKTDNEPPVSILIGELAEVALKENPTTGYSWNVSLSDGLVIVNETTIGPENDRIVGAGGVHVWTIKAVAPGNQSFSGVYRRSWEPPSDTDTTYIKQYIVLE